MKSKKNKPKESEIVKACLEYLAYKNIFAWRNNTGAFKNKNNHFYQFGYPGSPDIIAVVGGRFIGFECKVPGRKQNKNQVAFQEKLETAGGVYHLIYSLDDLASIL